eukprot:1156292-Pelagomonas_calceolata.AAC.2
MSGAYELDVVSLPPSVYTAGVSATVPTRILPPFFLSCPFPSVRGSHGRGKKTQIPSLPFPSDSLGQTSVIFLLVALAGLSQAYATTALVASVSLAKLASSHWLAPSLMIAHQTTVITLLTTVQITAKETSFA